MEENKITYRRNAGASYMILSQREEVSAFEEEMLKNNEIPVLLPFFTLWEEGKRQLWYDITGKKSMQHIMEQEGLDCRRLCEILLGVIEAYQTLDEYLIADSHILLRQDTLYLSGHESHRQVQLCFSPDEDRKMEDSLLSLYEYLMPMIDQEDERMVQIVYGGYQTLNEGAFSLDELKEELHDAMRPEEASRGFSVNSPEQEDPPGDYASQGRTEYQEDYASDIFHGDRALLDMYAPEESGFSEDEKESWIVKIRRRIKNGPGKWFDRFRKKKEEVFPPKDLEEDLIYHPEDNLSTPTVLLADKAESCFGRLVYEGDGNENDYVLDKKEYRVGSRDEKNDVLLHSAAVSRHHARIWREGEDYYIEDLNSTNGTFVNGETVNIKEPRKLCYMDKVCFADVEYRMV